MDFLFPDVGEGITEGRLVSWKVKAGDAVREEQPLCEVETDKAVVEIPSPFSGTIDALHAQEGDTIIVGKPLVSYTERVSDAPHDPDHARAPERGTARIESSLTPRIPKPEEHQPPLPTEHVANAQGPVTEQPVRVLATPSTRRLARERGVDVSTLRGTGPNGRVTPEDVLAAANHARPQSSGTARIEPSLTPTPPTAAPTAAVPAATPPAPPPAHTVQTTASRGTPIPYSGIRKAIGEHMVASHAVPRVTEVVEADVSLLVALRDHLKDRAAEHGARLTFLSLFAKATIAALHKHPVVNAHFLEEIVPFTDVHLGIAVDTARGLLVPVIRDAQHKSVLEIAKEIEVLAAQARDGILPAEQLSGSTFTITSIGPLRVEAFTPLINVPEVAILGIGAITDKPVVRSGQVVAGKTVTFSLTFDHRVFDGAEAARFLKDLADIVEDPELFLLEGV